MTKRHDDRTKIKHEVEGEGSHSAGANYRERTKEFIEEGKVDEAAERAEHALEGDERKELERAEAEAKSRRKSDDV